MPEPPASKPKSDEVKQREALVSELAEDKVPAAASLTPEQMAAIQAEITRIVAQNAPASRKSKQPQAEPDWKTLSELEATDMSREINIPVIEHDVPAYLEVRPADNEYVVVWANRDQRRIGQLEAEGYEMLRKEHVAKDFKLPLKFDSEGLYIYQDVIAMRVHKRILFAKRRRVQEISVRQLRGAQRIANEEVNRTVIQKDSRLESAFEKGSLGFYEPDPVL